MNMIIKGTVEKDIFFNEENNWGVFIFRSEDNSKFKLTGTIPSFYKGKKLEVECQEDTNSTYKEQYKILNVKVLPMISKIDIIEYLSSGLFFGVGEKTAEKIVNTFGEKTLEIIKENPTLLTKVRGITKQKALSLNHNAKNLEKMEESLQLLFSYGITTNQAIKIIEYYKDATITVISQNPYKLIEDFKGIGFLRADAIAEKVGIPKDSIMRLQKLILFKLDQFYQSGSTTINYEKLKEIFLKDSGLEVNQKTITLFEKAYKDLIDLKELVQTERDSITYVSDSITYNTEKQIAQILFNLKNSDHKEIKDIDTIISRYEKVNNIEMTQSQKNAVINSINSAVSIITGGPGTGKTTITKCIIEILKENNYLISQAAPTGRAAKKMEESTNFQAKTIHRLLNVQYDGSYFYNKNNKLSCNVLIVDEFSMCDTFIFYRLLQALEEDTKIILIGDKDQLQSVSPGNVLEDLIQSNQFPVNYLDHIFRQKEGSEIKEIAQRVNKREKINLNNYRALDNEVVFVETYEIDDMKDKIIKLITDIIPKKYNCLSKDIQILSPNKATEAGSDEINKIVQDKINPKSYNKKEIIFGDKIFREEDKVIHIKNDYQIKYVSNNEEGQGIFNGEIGFIKEIDNKIIKVEYDDNKIAEYKTAEQKSNLRLAYAISIHKSQGSEFDLVLIPAIKDNIITNNSKVLYTGITRSKKAIYLITNQRVLNSALSSRRKIQRTTQLKWFLQY